MTWFDAALIKDSMKETEKLHFSVTFIKSLNQSSIKPCLIVHLVAMWTLAMN